MAKFKISPALLIGLLIAAIFGISLLYRIYVPYGQVFVGDEIRYSSNDAYFYMRLVDNAAANFPHLTQFDPYFLFPGGNNVVSLPFFHWLIVVIAWVVGLGHPSQTLIDIIGVYLPAIIGALTVIPVFFIGKTLFNKWAGVLAAGLIAILPGEFLSRSLLGAGDNPVAEVFFTATALAFLIAAVKSASQRQLTFSHFLKWDWKTVRQPLLCSLLAGIFLGFYLATWGGALLFVLIIALYLIIQSIINHLRQKSNEYLCVVGFVTFLLALIVLLLNPFTTDITVAMVIAVFLPLVLYAISRFISGRGLKTYYYPLALVGIGVLAVAVVYFAANDTFTTLLSKIKFVFFPVGSTAATTIEMFPVLTPEGPDFTPLVAWGNFPMTFFIAPWWLIFGLGAAAICGYLCRLIIEDIKKGLPLTIFFGVSVIIMIILTANKMPLQYLMTQDEVKFIPGLAFISLSILFYTFIRRDTDQPWYIGVAWFVAIFILLVLLMIFATFPDIRYLALIPLAVFIYILFKHREGDEDLRLFIVWSLIILIIPLIQRRFQYYFAVNVALLSGYLCWEVIRLSGINKLLQKTEDTAPKELHFAAAPQKRDYYEVLGINNNASYKEVKSAFRRLTAGYRPGPGNTAEAEEKYKEINKAYQTLTNPSQRASYDSSRREASAKKSSRKHKGGGGKAVYYVNIILSIILIFLFVFCPNLAKAQGQASQAIYAVTDSWEEALYWMRDNTPDPMGDPNAYYKDYDAVPPGQEFQYPASAYGVSAWWDYGYWIIRIAHRIPSTNPSQSPGPIRKVSALFLSQNQTEIDEIRKELGSRYIIADYDIATGKYWAMINWAGQDPEKYQPSLYMAQENVLGLLSGIYGLDYYRSLLIRLYCFDGKAVTEQKPMVISYKMVKTLTGVEVKQVVDYHEFTTYQEALDFIASQDATAQYEIVGTNPFVSPIPMEAVEDYELVFASTVSANATTPSEVKIFEYIGEN